MKPILVLKKRAYKDNIFEIIQKKQRNKFNTKLGVYNRKKKFLNIDVYKHIKFLGEGKLLSNKIKNIFNKIVFNNKKEIKIKTVKKYK